MTTADKTTDVSFHYERDETDSEELIDKSFFFKVTFSVFDFEVWKDEDEWSDVWPDSFFELEEISESEYFKERILLWSDVWTNSSFEWLAFVHERISSLVSLSDGGV